MSLADSLADVGEAGSRLDASFTWLLDDTESNKQRVVASWTLLRGCGTFKRKWESYVRAFGELVLGACSQVRLAYKVSRLMVWVPAWV